MLRPVADTIPRVTVSVNSPSGLPMAIAVWPTCTAVSLPRFAATRCRPAGSILMTARSVVSPILTTVAS